MYTVPRKFELALYPIVKHIIVIQRGKAWNRITVRQVNDMTGAHPKGGLRRLEHPPKFEKCNKHTQMKLEMVVQSTSASHPVLPSITTENSSLILFCFSHDRRSHPPSRIQELSDHPPSGLPK